MPTPKRINKTPSGGFASKYHANLDLPTFFTPRQARSLLNWSQLEMSKALEMSFSKWKNLESGRKEPTKADLVMITWLVLTREKTFRARQTRRSKALLSLTNTDGKPPRVDLRFKHDFI